MNKIKKVILLLTLPIFSIATASCNSTLINKNKLSRLNFELNQYKKGLISKEEKSLLYKDANKDKLNAYEQILKEIKDENQSTLDRLNQVESALEVKNEEIITKIPFDLNENERIKNSEIIQILNQRNFEGYLVKEIWIKNGLNIHRFTKNELLQLRDNASFELDEKYTTRKTSANIHLLIKLKTLTEVKFQVFDQILEKKIYLDENGRISKDLLPTLSDLSKKDLGNEHEVSDFIPDSLAWKFQDKEIIFNKDNLSDILSTDSSKPIILSSSPKLTRYKKYFKQRRVILSSLRNIQRTLVGILDNDETIKKEIENSQESNAIQNIATKIGIYTLSWTQAREYIPIVNFLFDSIYLIINGSMGGKMSFDELSEYMIKLKDSAVNIINSLIPAANDGKFTWKWNWVHFAWEAQEQNGTFLQWDFFKAKFIYPELNEKAKLIRSGVNSALSILNSGIIQILNNFKNGIIKNEFIEDWDNSKLPYIVIKDVIYSLLTFIADSSYSVINLINNAITKANQNSPLTQEKIKAISKLIKALIGDNKNKNEGALKTIVDVIINSTTKVINTSQIISSISSLISPILQSIESSMFLIKGEVPQKLKIARGIIDLIATTVSIGSKIFNKTKGAIDIISTISKEISSNTSITKIGGSFLAQALNN